MRDIEVFVDPPDLHCNGTCAKLASENLVKTVTVVNGELVSEPGETDTFVKADTCNTSLVLNGDVGPRDSNQRGGFRRLLTDGKYRHRFLHTACVFWSMVAMGWRVGLTGPTFPDLRLIIDEDLSKSSWIFTSVSLGGLIGSVISGMAYDRFNKLAVFSVIDLGLAVTAAATPYCHTFPLMFTAHLLHGGFVSALDTAATSDVVHVWGSEGGPYMQAVHFGFSLGAIISPFVSEPFLAKKLQNTVDLASTTPVPHGVHNYTNRTIASEAHAGISLLQSDIKTAQLQVLGNASSTPSLLLPVELEYGETRIHVTYFISAVVSLTAAVSFIFLAVFMGSVYKKSAVSEQGKKTEPAKNSVKHLLSKKLKVFFSILMAAMLLVSVIHERHFRDFLMTFATTSLNWSKTRGSHITATFWIAYAVGRLSGVATVKYMRQTYVFTMYITILTSGTFALLLAVKYGIAWLMFVSTAFVGLGLSVLFASCFSWLSENVLTVTGKLTSAMFIVFSSGAMTFPLLAGYLMKNSDPRWFVYLQIILVIIMNAILVVVVVTYRCVSRRNVA